MTTETPARTRTAPELVRWRNAVFTIFALAGFGFATWVSRVPEVRDLLHASTDEMGLLIFAIAVGSILGLLGSSHLVARVGATRTIAWCYSSARSRSSRSGSSPPSRRASGRSPWRSPSSARARAPPTSR